MRIQCDRTHCAVNATLFLAVAAFGYYQWTESAAAVEQDAERFPYPQTWTAVSKSHAENAVAIGGDALQVGRAIEAMADALAAGDEPTYRRHLAAAESLSARGRGPARSREDLVRSAQEFHEQRTGEGADGQDDAGY